jgi:hypothetical protein
MRDIPEHEARTLLNRPLRCEEWGEWVPLKTQPATSAVGAGVLDEFGLGTRLYVEFLYRRDHKTKFTYYSLTVFKRNAYGRDRVYQLAVNQTAKPLKDRHRLSHEHFGDKRVECEAEWGKWSYDEVIAYFCARTKIVFAPKPPHPEHFQLRG